MGSIAGLCRSSQGLAYCVLSDAELISQQVSHFSAFPDAQRYAEMLAGDGLNVEIHHALADPALDTTEWIRVSEYRHSDESWMRWKAGEEQSAIGWRIEHKLTDIGDAIKSLRALTNDLRNAGNEEIAMEIGNVIQIIDDAVGIGNRFAALLN